jgi:predicted RNA-binding Zn-ribbon protein involved in translation (DUF1610 family)
MRTLLVLAALALGTTLPYGCTTPGEMDDTATEVSYKCPKCMETVQWKYEGTELWKTPQNRSLVKTVKHNCPSCKKTWEASVATESTCDECQLEHLQCPICRKHG